MKTIVIIAIIFIALIFVSGCEVSDYLGLSASNITSENSQNPATFPNGANNPPVIGDIKFKE